MNTSGPYIPSRLLPGDGETLREQSLTRWMSRDLMQAATDFCRNLGLVPVYCEYSTGHLTRYLFWRVPPGAAIEVRSGRDKNKFEEFDRVNSARHWRLLSLHVNDHGFHSAVWISAGHFEIAKNFLLAHGIVPAERTEA
jgi:hypothetical protein